MKVYFAPMEGITGYVFRNVHHRFYNHITEYYTPFIVPNQTRRLTSREMNDILPEHNRDIPVVPQILTNKADDFVWAARKAQTLGYREVNLNLGCPSATVVPKHRGAGFLAYPDELDRFLETVAEELDTLGIRLSVKTRIGLDDPSEFDRLLQIYNRYPMEKLIIHPRVRTDYYRNHPNMEVFRMAVKNSIHPVCYNGDLFSVGDVACFHEKFPAIDSVMLGRGLLTDPALAGKVEAGINKTETCGREGGEKKKRRLRQYHDALLDGYREVMSGDRNVLFKMKELWFYLAYRFEDGEKPVKRIRKANSMEAYEDAVNRLFGECELAANNAFPGTP